MKPIDVSQNNRSYWQSIFLQSKANGAAYNGDDLPGWSWNWPKKYLSAAPIVAAQVSTPGRKLKIELARR